jgi:hypothetical protein
VEEPPQPLVTHRVVRGIDRLVVLPEELRVLPFGEVSQGHQRIGGVFGRLRGHVTQLTPDRRPRSVRRTVQDTGAPKPVQVIRLNDQVHCSHHPALSQSLLQASVVSGAN